MKIPNRRTLINTKKIFIISFISIIITVLSVWFYGIGEHKTVIENSLISTSILSVAFFLYITISLYNGTKLKDNLGKLTDKFDSKKLNFLKEINVDNGFGHSMPDIGEGIGGVIMSVILWILATIIISYLFFCTWINYLVFNISFLGNVILDFFQSIAVDI